MSVFDEEGARRRAKERLADRSIHRLHRIPGLLDLQVGREVESQRKKFQRQQADRLRERISERERGRRQMSPMGRGLTTAGVRTGRQQTGLLSAPDTLPSLLGDA